MAGLLLLWSIAVEVAYLHGRGAPGNLVAGIVIFALAVIAALRDVRALQNRAREEQRDLLESTLKEIETEAKSKGREPRREHRNGTP